MVDFRHLSSLYKPVLMGIINLTPDSFSDGGDMHSFDILNKNISELWQSGANIIDIGAESTRPDAVPVDSDTEINRLSLLSLPLKPVPYQYYSIDTYKSQTAEFALKNGFHIVNDITGLKHDINMAKIIADYQASVVIMYNHRLNTNKTTNILGDCFIGLQQSLDIALSAGICANKICLDVGIGFGMNPIENMIIINSLESFKMLGFPLLVGASRKSFMYHLLNLENPKNRLGATLATHHYAVKNGANIIRIHDVDEHRQFFAMMPFLNVS